MNPEVIYEIQVSESGEANLPQTYESCKKNPGHKKYIDISEFGIQHLPDGCKENDVVNLVRSLADITVSITVTFTSPRRPDFFPNTKTAYPNSKYRGKRILTTGTGWVWRVFVFSDTSLNITCPCQKCQATGQPSKIWGEIQLYTCAHVVFDDVEAKNTTCKFFFDSIESKPVNLVGWRVENSDTTLDRCLLVYETCDLNLLEKVNKMQIYWWDQWDKVNSKYKCREGDDQLTIIVSHPHGCPKKVSLGKVIERSTTDEGGTVRHSTYKYTTCTCPGSSGARVYFLRGEEGWVYKHLHRGVDLEQMNFSTPGGDFRYLS